MNNLTRLEQKEKKNPEGGANSPEKLCQQYYIFVNLGSESNLAVQVLILLHFINNEPALFHL